MHVVIAVQLVLLLVPFSLSTESKNCSREFRRKNYIPNFAAGLKCTNLEVRYDKKVNCGETVSTLKARNTPTLKFDATDRCENVTVIGFIPDVTLFPPYCLWIAHNIPSHVMKKGFSNGGTTMDRLDGKKEGDVKAVYILPAVNPGDTGARNQTVVYFVYCQCQYISDLRPFNRLDRQSFDPKKYAKQHGLKCPLAGLFHLTSLTGGQLLPTIIEVPYVNPGTDDIPKPQLPLPLS